jgi:predicted RNase H-like HicB family nuclease
MEKRMKTYTFRVVVEPDEEGWRVFYPPWEEIGASTWGKTEEEALRNITEVLSMILEEFTEEGKPIPITERMTVSEEALVTVNV